jgi:hypothetical protein
MGEVRGAGGIKREDAKGAKADAKKTKIFF